MVSFKRTVSMDGDALVRAGNRSETRRPGGDLNQGFSQPQPLLVQTKGSMQIGDIGANRRNS